MQPKLLNMALNMITVNKVLFHFKEAVDNLKDIFEVSSKNGVLRNTHDKNRLLNEWRALKSQITFMQASPETIDSLIEIT